MVRFAIHATQVMLFLFYKSYHIFSEFLFVILVIARGVVISHYGYGFVYFPL